MSDVDSAPNPRRSQRERKNVQRFNSNKSPSKRKRTERDDSQDELTELTELTEHTDGEEHNTDSGNDAGSDDEKHQGEDGEFSSPQAKPKNSAIMRKGKGKSKGIKPPVVKKQKALKIAAQAIKKPAAKKTRKTKAANGVFDAEQIASETKIKSDNPLFNAIMNPSAALQSTVEDFLDSLMQSPGVAQAEFITCILRSCGCNDSVDADEVVDYDGVVDALDNFTEGLKQEDSPIYPLTSKLPIFKKFRKSLSEFIERLILAAAETASLYTTDLMATLQTWVVAMSSSQIRSFRHTATVWALEVETALCDVAASVEKEAEVVGRQREGERKRKASNKTSGAREKELEKKAAEIRQRRATLAEFLKEFVDGVFVHRYRDLDPNIRAECVRAMGLWFKKYPAHFLDSSYLRYVGWVLSDSNTQVRLEAVKSLAGVYDQGDYVGSFNHFTERFKPRLIEMATGDTDLAVRIAVIEVLGSIDGHSLLEDEEREKLCLLVFDEEARARKAVSGFVKGVWEDLIEERSVGRKLSEKDSDLVGIKALGILLVKWSKALDKLLDASDEEISVFGESSSSQLDRAMPMAPLIEAYSKGRIFLAVEALWNEVEPVSNWEALLDVLLLDHSTPEDDDLDNSSLLVQGKNKSVDDAWRLQEVEESVLLEVLVASLNRAKVIAAANKKGAEDTVVSDITRALIKGLPRLFIKYQTDEKRISDVLQIPPLMNLDMYLEMRMITAYANLWDDVTKQFISHSSSAVLSNAATVFRRFMDATSLSNTNNTKVLELEDELSTQLRDAVAGREEIEVASFSEDEVLSLGAICSRLTILAGSRDMTTWMEEDEGGKQSSAWDIISALAERGRLGYKEEERMVEQALHFLGLHIIWKARGLSSTANSPPEKQRLSQSLVEQRNILVEKLIGIVTGTQSNAAQRVKRAAFQILMNIHILFYPSQATALDGSPSPTALIALKLDDEVQYRCAGFIQSEIEQYAEQIDSKPQAQEQEESSGSDSDAEDQPKTSKGKTQKKKQATPNGTTGSPSSRARLEQEYVFMGLVSTFLRAIRAGAVHVKHSHILLTHFGRLGAAFDLCTKVINDVLREEGMLFNRGDIVVSVITQALRESFTLVLDDVVAGEEHAVSLSKQLASSLIIRGAQLSVVRRLDSRFIVQIHTTLLTWISKRLSTYESNKNKRSRNAAILFFRVLLPLLGAVEPRDALTIKAHMDQILAQDKIEIPATSKIWEPQRAYEKRLSNVKARDKVIRGHGKGKGGQKAAMVTSEEEDSESEGPVPEEEEVPARKRPKPRPVRRHLTSPERNPPLEVDEDVDEESDALTPLSQLDEPVVNGQENQNYSPEAPLELVDSDSTTSVPNTARKRGRSPGREVFDDSGVDGLGEQPSDTLPMQTTKSEDVTRRKRARH